MPVLLTAAGTSHTSGALGTFTIQGHYALAAAYSASVTASWNSVAPIVVVVCDISVARRDLEQLPVLIPCCALNAWPIP